MAVNPRISGCAVGAIAQVFFATVGGSAHAQNTVQRDEVAGTSEIVVTAQRRAQALSEVPSAIQAFEGEALTRSGITEVRTAINLIPGASKQAEISSGWEAYQIRGVSSGQATGDQTVGFYIDDFAYSLANLPYAPSANFYDLDRMEVIRGPSGTLYGQGSFGGTIRVLTKEPDLEEFGGSFLVSASTTEGGAPNGAANAMLNIPIVPGKLAVRGVVTYDRKGGYVDMPLVNKKNGNDSDVLYGRVKLLYQPTDDLKILLSYARNRTDQGFTNRMDSIKPPEANDTGNGESPLRYNMATGTIEYNFGGAALTSITGRLRQKLGLTAFGSQPAFGDYDITATYISKVFSQELRLASTGHQTFNWVVGAYYRDAKTTTTQDFAVTIPGFLANDNSTIKSESIALYAEGSLDLMEGFLIPTVGGRYFKEKRELDADSTLTIFGPPVSIIGPTLQSTSRKSNAFSPRFNLALHPSEDGMFYAEVAKGFRSGAIQTPASVGALAILGVTAESALQADTLWNYELGTKWQFLNNTLQFELAAYQYDWKDAQIQFSPAGLTAIIQVGDVRGRGVDLTLGYKTPLDGLRLQLVGNVNQAKLRNVPGAITAAVPHLANGKRLPGSPKRTLTISGDYRHPLGATGYDILANARYNFRHRQRDVVTGLDSATVEDVSARIGFGTEKFEAFLFADNIFNEIGPAEIDSGRFVMPYPRTIGVSVSGRF